MQEGMRSLVQMHRIAAAGHELRAAGVPHVSVVRSPTTGGVWAALAAGADVVLARRDATVAFAGRRVRNQDARDEEAFTSEGKLAAGHVDLLVDDSELQPTLAVLLDMLTIARSVPPAPADVPSALGRGNLPPDGWSAVQRARDPERPRAQAYLERYFDARVPVSGDRAGGSDAGMLCGIGRRQGRPIAYAAQSGTANTPAGFRTAARLIRLADRLNLPILTLIDTPGAANDAAAERGGVGTAIAELLAAVAGARVPITTLVIGEGGSGGALGIGVADHVMILENAYYSVISPEACSAILWKDRRHAAEAAEALKLTAQDLMRFNVVDEIVSEPDGGAHRDHEKAAKILGRALRSNLERLLKIPINQLLKKRYEKFRRLGNFAEPPKGNGATG